MKPINSTCASGRLLLLALLPIVAEAQFDYTIANNTVTITKYTGLSGAVTIPDTIGGRPVTTISGTAFFEQAHVTSVTIGDWVSSIQAGAFATCRSLTAITVGGGNPYYRSSDGVLFDRDRATLLRCPAGRLGSYLIPITVSSIAPGAFADCSGLTSVNLGVAVASIGDAFATCRNLTAITVSGGNPYYSGLAGVLFDRSRITLLRYPASKSGSYAIPVTVSSIGPGAFADCTGLTSVAIGNAVTGLEGAFASCSRLTAINVSEGNPNYRSLDGVLFDRDRTRLLRYPAGRVGSYTIPRTVSGVAAGAFAGCADLLSLTIGMAVAGIDSGAFATCSSLMAIMVDESNPYYRSVDGVLFDRDQFTLLRYPTGRSGSYAVPSTVSSVGPGAFANCTGLTSVTLGMEVNSIGEGALSDCANLTGVYCKGNAPEAGTNVFRSTDQATVYYLSGTTGWQATYGGRPTALWNPRMPSGEPGWGVADGQFGFKITGADGLLVVVEACSDLGNPQWVMVGTIKLKDGWARFSDPGWANHSGRFYRLRSP